MESPLFSFPAPHLPVGLGQEVQVEAAAVVPPQLLPNRGGRVVRQVAEHGQSHFLQQRSAFGPVLLLSALAEAALQARQDARGNGLDRGKKDGQSQ